MLRVLMVVPNLSVANGVASFAMNYFRRLNHEDVKIDFVVDTDIQSSYYTEIYNAGGEIYVLPSILQIFQYYKKCKKILEDKRYDIIHANSLHAGLLLMIIAKINKIPTRILHAHGSKLGSTKLKTIRNTLFLPLLRSTATDYAACSLVAGETLFRKRIYTIIPNMIDENRFFFDEKVRNQVRSEMSSEKKFIIATVGRMAVEKNPFFAVDTFKTFSEKYSNTEYWWIGEGPLKEKIAAYVQTQKMEDKIKLFGNRTDVVDLYRAIDCLFLPSIYEGLPVVGVEAQAMGLPCIISDTVTRELKYTDLVQYISLDAPAEEWCEGFFWAMKDRDRAMYNQQLRQSSFASEKAGSILEEYYKALQKKNG